MKLGALLLEWLYPRRAACVSCGSMLGNDRDDLCEECRAKLAAQWVGVGIGARRFGVDGAAYAYRYHGPAGAMVRCLKYGGAWTLAEEMGRDLARAANLMRMEKIDAVTAVPMHRRRVLRRDRNHAEVLARVVAAELGLEYRELLGRTWNAPQQARLTKRERQQNLKGGFAALQELRGRRILLIDDVLTTGSTVKSCAVALRAAGAEKVFFAAYALAERGKEHGKDHKLEKSGGAAAAVAAFGEGAPRGEPLSGGRRSDDPGSAEMRTSN